jgi:hypothetical protein
MTGPVTFGRKTAAPASAPRLAPRPAPQSNDLSPEAEAFRARLKRDGAVEASEFSGWLRANQGRRWLAWTLGLALMAPGVLCFAFQAPGEVSGGLEVLGVAGNWWLRRERRRRLKEIASWTPTDL